MTRIHNTGLRALAMCVLIVLLSVLAAGTAAGQGTATRGTRTPAPFVHSSPQGMYVACGLLLASPAHPVGDTVGYRIERKTGRGSWTQIADVHAPASLEELLERVDRRQLDDAVRRMKLAGVEELWNAMLASPRLEKILITPDRKTLTGLGLLYLDATAERGTTYEYRVSMLLASAVAVRPRTSPGVLCGTAWPMTVMRPIGSSETDSSVRITWSARAPKPLPAVMRVERRLSGQEEFRVLDVPGAMFMKGDSVFCTVADRGLRASQQYEYQVVPEDFYGNEGPVSQPATVFTMNFSRLPLPQNLKAMKDSNGVLLSWSTLMDEHIIATRIFRSDHYDTGYVKIADVPATTSSYLDVSAAGMSRYYYKFSNLTFDNRESQRTGVVVGWMRSVIPPATPQNLKAVSVTGGVQLTWDANKEKDIAAYYVCRSGGAYDTLMPVSAGLTATRWLDTSLTLSGTRMYRYAVRAVNHSELLSEYSNVEVVRPGIATSPKPPQSLIVRPRADRFVLNWNDPRTYDETVVGYVIYRSERTPPGQTPDAQPPGGKAPQRRGRQAQAQAPPQAADADGFVRIAELTDDPDRTIWVDSTITVGRRYLYAVASIDMVGGEGVRSAPVEGWIRIEVPVPPADVRASRDEKGLRVEWEEVSDEAAAEINIYRREQGGTAKKIATVPAAKRAYSDTSVKKGIVYYYAVSVLKKDKPESAKSVESWARP